MFSRGLLDTKGMEDGYRFLNVEVGNCMREEKSLIIDKTLGEKLVQ